MSTIDRPYFPALLVALGVAVAGLAVGRGFATGQATDRFVEVKGLAEQNVEADLALWPLRFVATGNDLTTAQAQVERFGSQVMTFLARNGIVLQQSGDYGMGGPTFRRIRACS